MKILHLSLVMALLMIFLAGCAPTIHSHDYGSLTPRLTNNLFIADDGAGLPVRLWLPDKEANAVLIALHGFNDYGKFFERPGHYFSSLGIACFAYDQRGFGVSPKRGQWAGKTRYINDLNLLIHLVKKQYPRQPVYLLGESMGGAVIINAMAEQRPANAKVEGIILAAPALWARETMPWYQSSLLWTLTHTVPWLRLTGEGVEVQASDNIPMLRELGRDPLVIKKTRVDAINGLADLMDDAYRQADKLSIRSLILYGEKDEVIPKQPTYDFINRFLKQGADNKTVAIYPAGYHMLLRDLKAQLIWHDIALWINHDAGKLPSGADQYAGKALKQYQSGKRS